MPEDQTNQTNRLVVQREIGDPRVVAELVDVPVPVPGDGELLVELVEAPIHPAELLMLEGRYGYGDSKPGVPRNVGIDGVGRVVGGDTSAIPVGTLVSLAGSRTVFSDYSIIPAANALVIPPDVDTATFAASFINIQSVLIMLDEWPELERGDWIIQNAGNSSYGRILDAIADARGLHVVNVVRSASSAAQIEGTARGPVVIDSDDLPAQVRTLTGGNLPKVAVDAIGGTSTGRLAASLANGGRVSTYGVLSGEPIQVDTELVLFNGIRLEGFWMPVARGHATPERLATLGAEAVELIAAGRIAVPVHARFPLSEVSQAMAAAAESGRDGKVLLTR